MDTAQASQTPESSDGEYNDIVVEKTFFNFLRYKIYGTQVFENDLPKHEAKTDSDGLKKTPSTSSDTAVSASDESTPVSAYLTGWFGSSTATP